MIEDLSRRTSKRKVFDKGGGKFQTQVSLGVVHYNDGNDFQDIDLTPVDMGTFWLVDKAPYTIRIIKDHPRIEYVSRLGGEVEMDLRTIGGRNARKRRDFAVVRNLPDMNPAILYPDYETDFDFWLQLKNGGVEWFKKIKSPTAPHEMEWDVDISESRTFRFRETIKGWEENERPNQAQGGRRRRMLEVTRSTPAPTVANGVESYQFEEVITGRISEQIDRTTRQREWRTDPVYPLIIDTLIDEDIQNSTDDVYNSDDSGYTGQDFLIGTSYGDIGVGGRYSGQIRRAF